MKKNIIVLILILLPCLIFSLGFETQFETAKKYADKDEMPVEFYDPGTSETQGYILYADIDGEQGDEMIIPYRVRHMPKGKKQSVSIYEQHIVVDIIRGEKKISNFINMELAYSRTPIVYLTTRELFNGETPKVILMAYDGIENEKNKDKFLTLAYNGFDPKDLKRRNQKFTTIKMPWDLIFYQFDDMVPDIIEYHTLLRERKATFYIRKADKEMPDPFIGQKKMNVLKDMLKEYDKNIQWRWDSKTENKKK
jgi:hypothetical protein